MPLDIQLFREDQGGDIAKIKKSQAARFDDEKAVDSVIELDNQWRNAAGKLDIANRDRKKLDKEFRKNRKTMTDEQRADLKARQEDLDAQKQHWKDEKLRLEIARNVALSEIGNIVHESVPISKDEHDNEVVGLWGDAREPQDFEVPHHELLYRIGGYEPTRGAQISGHRGYFLTGPGVMLNMALQAYGIDFLMQREYTAVQPPYFMNKEAMQATAQLSDFDEQLYHVTGEHMDVPKYLIATSEQPISAMHMKEWLKKGLPYKYAGVSTCFRKEAGGHGRDVWGIFRVHQFEKIEQFVLCAPDDSWKLHEEMRETSEDFYKSLGIPYQVVAIVSGELNNAAAKKYDLEGWFPTRKEYKELVSCSNCTDYQSRAMETRFGAKSKNDREKKYVHMLNSTLCATTRTICCILENFQTPEGVRVPPALVPYCRGVDFFPFVRKFPKNMPLPKHIQNIGSNKQKSQELVEILQRHGLDVTDELKEELEKYENKK